MNPHAPNTQESRRLTRMRTILHVDNIHCQSCVDLISGIVATTSPPSENDPEKAEPLFSDVDISATTHTVSFTHPRSFSAKTMLKQLDAAGFDVWIDSKTPTTSPIPTTRPPRWRWLRRQLSFHRIKSSQREAVHRETCRACRTPEGSVTNTIAESNDTEEQALYETRVAIDGISCSSCISSISTSLSPSTEPGIKSCQVTLLPQSAVIVHDTTVLSADNIKKLIEEIGYDAEIISSEILSPALESVRDEDNAREPVSYKARYSILGMTCASCVSAVTSAIESIPGTTAVSVDLIGKTGSTVVRRREDAELVRTEVEDAGFECTIVEILEQYDTSIADIPKARTVNVKVDGMVCGECVNKVNGSLEGLSLRHGLTYTPISIDNSAVSLTYMPKPPSFTLRDIRNEIAALGFTLSVVHADSIEERASHARARERRHILLRLCILFLFTIPTFTIGVVGMSLLRKDNAFRASLETPVWGNASRGTVALFALTTPVQFGIGWFFYTRAWKSLKGVWRKRRDGANWKRVWLERLFRWGSMDTLVSLGTSTGYFASLALMILDIKTTPREGMMGGEMGWFDSSVFLMLFILAGRYLESISKQHTGDAIATLSSTKPATGLLFTPTGSSTTEESVDFLEVGDTLLVPVGASPPLDATVAPSSPPTTFDESSLTGEARPVPKSPTDTVFAGTTNAGPAAAVVTITSETGKTMLDGIVSVVRDAMGKKAGIERIADIVTGYFVPCVVGIAALTFGVWCLRGYLGVLPAEWLADSRRKGGWALFAVQFGVAVLVVACPCGIGLAAPTAQLVGVGLAAQHGVLSNGGGEAFQTISSINTVVLDKTGTLTTSKFTISDHRIFVNSTSHGMVWSMVLAAEQASTHPLAVGVRDWCRTRLTAGENPPVTVDLISSEEIPGRGLVTILVAEGNKLEIAIGNENLMQDIQAEYASDEVSAQAKNDLLAWQTGGKSVVVLSAKIVSESSSTPLDLPINSECHSVLGLFGVHDPPRPEAETLVAELQSRGIDVWMISGDNATTAKTVARSVGIDEAHVVAGALPIDKQKWVQKLQSRQSSDHTRGKRWWRLWGPRQGRSIVAFVGDGINDAPALAQADTGIAMGSGSAVALSTASFHLLSSNLLSLLTIHDLARATRNKIISNFVWACLYNVGLIPLAAGAFYTLGHTKLPPVWGSASMALSSVSVVVNSLALRWLYKPPKVVREWEGRKEQV